MQKNSKGKYDLEERTAKFGKDIIKFDSDKFNYQTISPSIS